MLTKKQAYYIEQFKKIERNELSWNWAAFCYPPLWLIYRKVYSGLLKSMIIGAMLLVASFVVEPFVGLKAFGIAVFLWFSICGLFGNKWYYSTVKYRLTHGYHLYEGFKPTSSFLVWFSILASIADGLLKTRFFEIWGYILILIYWYKDKRNVRIIINDKAITNEEFTTENIAKLI